MDTDVVRPAGQGAEREACWLPSDWTHPARVPVGPGHHLRPVRASDVDLDLAAVLASRERLWSVYGRAWGWPPAGLTREQDLADLVRREAETEAHESFDYALLDDAESRLLGCVYVDPPVKVGADAEISWWVVDEVVGSELAAALDALVPAWIATEWPLRRPRFVGRDLSWDAWLALPDMPTWAMPSVGGTDRRTPHEPPQHLTTTHHEHPRKAPQ